MWGWTIDNRKNKTWWVSPGGSLGEQQQWCWKQPLIQWNCLGPYRNEVASHLSQNLGRESFCMVNFRILFYALLVVNLQSTNIESCQISLSTATHCLRWVLNTIITCSNSLLWFLSLTDWYLWRLCSSWVLSWEVVKEKSLGMYAGETGSSLLRPAAEEAVFKATCTYNLIHKWEHSI